MLITDILLCYWKMWYWST